MAAIKNIHWHINSCTSLTLCNNSSMFKSLDYTKNNHFTTANGAYIRTTATSMVCIKSVGAERQTAELFINNAHYCPEVSANLISLGQLTWNGCQMLGYGTVMNIYNLFNNPVVYSRGQQDVYVINTIHLITAAVVPQGATLVTWHKWLGHTNYGYIKKLNDYINISNRDCPFCKPYTKGKQHNVYSKELATYRVTEPGQCWHVNLVSSSAIMVTYHGGAARMAYSRVQYVSTGHESHVLR